MGNESGKSKTQPSSIAPVADPEHPRNAFAAGIGDQLRVIYLPDGVAPWNRKYVAKGLAADVHYTATYIDPMTGKSYPKTGVTPESNGDWRLPAAPILQDWVLVIERGSK